MFKKGDVVEFRGNETEPLITGIIKECYLYTNFSALDNYYDIEYNHEELGL